MANGNESIGPSHKEVGSKTRRCALLKAFRKKKKKSFTDRTPPKHSFWAQIHVHRVTDLQKFPVRISKDDAPTPLPVVGPLFISPLSFHLSRALLGAWRFGLFRCVYSSFSQQARSHQGACLLLGVLFYFPNLSVFVSSYVKMKKFCSF